MSSPGSPTKKKKSVRGKKKQTNFALDLQDAWKGSYNDPVARTMRGHRAKGSRVQSLSTKHYEPDITEKTKMWEKTRDEELKSLQPKLSYRRPTEDSALLYSMTEDGDDPSKEEQGFSYAGEYAGLQTRMPRDLNDQVLYLEEDKLLYSSANPQLRGEKPFASLEQSLIYNVAATRIQSWFRGCRLRDFIHSQLRNRSTAHDSDSDPGGRHFSRESRSLHRRSTTHSHMGSSHSQSAAFASTKSVTESVTQLSRLLKSKGDAVGYFGLEVHEFLRQAADSRKKPKKVEKSESPFFPASRESFSQPKRTVYDASSDASESSEEDNTDILDPHSLNMVFRRRFSRVLSTPNPMIYGVRRSRKEKRVEHKRKKSEAWKTFCEIQLQPDESLEIFSISGNGKVFLNAFDSKDRLVAKSVLLYSSTDPACAIAGKKKGPAASSNRRGAGREDFFRVGDHALLPLMSELSLWYFAGDHRYVFYVEGVVDRVEGPSASKTLASKLPSYASVKIGFCRTWLFAPSDLAPPEEMRVLKKISKRHRLFPLEPGMHKPPNEEMQARPHHASFRAEAAQAYETYGGEGGGAALSGAFSDLLTKSTKRTSNQPPSLLNLSPGVLGEVTGSAKNLQTVSEIQSFMKQNAKDLGKQKSIAEAFSQRDGDDDIREQIKGESAKLADRRNRKLHLQKESKKWAKWEKEQRRKDLNEHVM